MSKEKFDRLLKKYWNAESSLNEEEHLFDADIQRPAMQAWSGYVKQKRKNVPPGLKASIWATIQNRKKRRQRFIYSLSGVAASIVLFIAISINNTRDPDLNYEEKKALLSEALSMFSDKKQPSEKQNIIYEDEMIIIYTTSK